MTAEKTATSSWDIERRLITTHISGDADQADIEQWESSLNEALAQIKNNETFRIFVNLHGFKAADLGAHKRFRDIIPLTLAAYGWKTGYIDLFEEAAEQVKYTHTRGIRCIAAAHCHHDPVKMELYETRFGRSNEHFFKDPEEAEKWISALRDI